MSLSAPRVYVLVTYALRELCIDRYTLIHSLFLQQDDWEEWMRRFAIRLLQEAPSPALRATAGLAQAYQPLARELFSAAFACCWKELSDAYRSNLVNALETAFVADVSAEILQS